jgi:hypothetical protein
VTNWCLGLWLFPKLLANEFQIFLVECFFLFTISMLSLSLYRPAVDVGLDLFFLFVLIDNEALADLGEVVALVEDRVSSQ